MKTMQDETRELTRGEKSAIRKLVKSSCANYDREFGCLLLDLECYMFNKWWTGAYCRYFVEAVLPLDPALAASLSGAAVMSRPCAFCGEPFPIDGKRAYCSAGCSKKAQCKRNREHMRKKRG
jgi:hypothetical protein